MPHLEDYMYYIVQFLPFVIIIAIFYFFMIRPQRKRDKEEREMRNSVQPGDEICTIGGFIGRVVSVKDDTLVIETSADRTRLRLYRWAIRNKENAPAADAKKDAKETKEIPESK